MAENIAQPSESTLSGKLPPCANLLEVAIQEGDLGSQPRLSVRLGREAGADREAEAALQELRVALVDLPRPPALAAVTAL